MENGGVRMTLMIRIYMTVCVMLLLFDVIFLLVKNMRHHQLYPRNTKFEKKIQMEVAKYKEEGKFTEGFEEELLNQLKKTKNLITLVGIIDDDLEMENIFHDYILAQMKEYRKKSDEEQAYYTYVVSNMDYSKKRMSEEDAGEYIKFLDSKSLYTFTNAVNGFYNFGEVYTMLSVIEKIDEKSVFYHKKLLVDGLLSVNINRSELCEELEKRFEQYSLDTKIALVDFFRMSGHKADILCMRLMKSDTIDRELNYAAARYFVKHLNQEAAEYFVSILQKPDSDWVKQMIAIQAFENFKNPQLRALIKTKITSRNWHIRSNAISYLHSVGMDKEEIIDILSLNDKYTNEALLYQYKDDDEKRSLIINALKAIAQTEAIKENATKNKVIEIEEGMERSVAV